MTWEEYRKAVQATSQPSLEDRVKWLEADASAQRTAILKLERAFKSFAFHCCIALAVYAAALLVLLT
jgi:hypothetical protein